MVLSLLSTLPRPSSLLNKLLPAILAAFLPGALLAEEISLKATGVALDLGTKGSVSLGIPAMDGRNTHAGVDASTLKIDGKELSARYRAPFGQVTVRMRILPENAVEYTFESLPEDARLAMCQFNIPSAVIEEGLTVIFDERTPTLIPPQAGKTNAEVRLASLNAHRVEIAWADGTSLQLEAPFACWFGIQDSRIWGKDFVGVCLTPPLKRDAIHEDKTVFVLKFGVRKPNS